MFQTITAATALAILASASASSSSLKGVLSAKKNKLGLQQIIAKGAPVAAGFTTAAAVDGNWLTDATCGTTAFSAGMGYLMGYCATEDDTMFHIYSCTQDASTGSVVLSSTSYTDSACSLNATVQTAVTYTGTCTSETTYSCPATSTYSATIAEYSKGGLAISEFATAAKCTSDTEADVVSYIGMKGCIEGSMFGADSLAEYDSADCTGTATDTYPYSLVAYMFACSILDDDNINDDTMYDYMYDDLSGGVAAYNDLYQSFTWGNSDDDDDKCFHVESVIDYKGVQYSYKELQAGKEPECSVPHSPFSKGVIISTSCDNKTVRVTDTHLLATPQGFRLAYSLKAGDVLFGDYHDQTCTVTSVQKEQSVQQYFGLNCVHSEVLASGLRASTFGDFHTLPSWYMTYVGGLVGTDTASFLGGYIAEWYFIQSK